MLEASRNNVAPESSSGAGSAQEPRRREASTGEEASVVGAEYASVAALAQGAAEMAALAAAGANMSSQAGGSKGSARALGGWTARDRGTSSNAYAENASSVRAFGLADGPTGQATRELKEAGSRHDPAARLAGKSPSGGELDRGDSLEPTSASKSSKQGDALASTRPSATPESSANQTNTTTGIGSLPSGLTSLSASAAAQAGVGVAGAQRAGENAQALRPAALERPGADSAKASALARAPVTAAVRGAGGSGQSGGNGTSNQSSGQNVNAGAGRTGAGGKMVQFSLRNAQGGSSADATQAQEQPVEAQAVRGLAAVLRQKGGTVTLRLAPESLGELRISMKLEGAQVWAEIETSSDSARQLLEDQRDSLRGALEARGLKVERLEVSSVKPDAADGSDRHHAKDRAASDGSREHALGDNSPTPGEDRRHAERWGGTPQDHARSGSGSWAGEAGGAGEMVVTVRGAPVNVWAEPDGTSLRLRVDAVA